jgi:hypothetical protein
MELDDQDDYEGGNEIEDGDDDGVDDMGGLTDKGINIDILYIGR